MKKGGGDFAAGVYLSEAQNPIPPPSFIYCILNHRGMEGELNLEKVQEATCSQRWVKNTYSITSNLWWTVNTCRKVPLHLLNRSEIFPNLFYFSFFFKAHNFFSEMSFQIFVNSWTAKMRENTHFFRQAQAVCVGGGGGSAAPSIQKEKITIFPQLFIRYSNIFSYIYTVHK